MLWLLLGVPPVRGGGGAAAQKEAPAVSRARIIVSANAWAWASVPHAPEHGRLAHRVVHVVATTVALWWWLHARCVAHRSVALGLLSCPCGPPPHSHCGGHHVPAVACHDAHVAPRCCSPIMSQHSRTELQPSWLSLWQTWWGSIIDTRVHDVAFFGLLGCLHCCGRIAEPPWSTCLCGDSRRLPVDQRTCRAHGCIACRE